MWLLRSRNNHATTSTAAGNQSTSSYSKNVQRITPDERAPAYRITIPPGIRPGDRFRAQVGPQVITVTCPSGCRPGQVVRIGLTGAAVSNNGDEQQQQRPLNSDNVQRIPCDSRGPASYWVTIPEGVKRGSQFTVTIEGDEFAVTCPRFTRPGKKIKIVPPPPAPPSTRDARNGGGGTLPADSTTSTATSSSMETTSMTRRTEPPADKLTPRGNTTQDMFEVTVPDHVRPGESFPLRANGVRVLVTCPEEARPGQKIRFRLPVLIKPEITSPAAAIRLSYDRDGWTRTFRVSDMKFQWVRFDPDGAVDTQRRFDTERSAYVCRLEYNAQYRDDALRPGKIAFVAASSPAASVESSVQDVVGNTIVDHQQIAEAQVKTYTEKVTWFQAHCKHLAIPWEEGHVELQVRRDYLLHDSIDTIMNLSRQDMRRIWRVEFKGEAGLDAGGLSREWFQLVTELLFDPDRGLWMSSESNQMCLQINPVSDLICSDHLVYFRFLGRVMGKALFDGELIAGHMVQYLYKHILGWPISFKDIESIDQQYYNNLKQIRQMADDGQDVSFMCLDFSTTYDVMGAKQEVELFPGGKNCEVTNDNWPEYLEACLKNRMLTRIKPQLKELLLGFFDVIPEPLLTVFDFQELELLLCGLPEIDVHDWRNNTQYKGPVTDRSRVCQWFWETVTEMDQEGRARLLQFVTGTSGVPARGFAYLHGNDGNIKKFTIHGVPVEECLYPRAHTCFNRIDLPLYTKKAELVERLTVALAVSTTGFDLE